MQVLVVLYVKGIHSSDTVRALLGKGVLLETPVFLLAATVVL